MPAESAIGTRRPVEGIRGEGRSNQVQRPADGMGLSHSAKPTGESTLYEPGTVDRLGSEHLGDPRQSRSRGAELRDQGATGGEAGLAASVPRTAAGLVGTETDDRRGAGVWAHSGPVPRGGERSAKAVAPIAAG